MEPGESVNYLGVVDYCVFSIILFISLFIGLYLAFTGGKQKTVQEYLVGNRNMGALPITMSLLATFHSAMGMISIPAEIYMYDAGTIYSTVTMIFAMPVVALCYLPTFYELRLTSVYEYLEKRFNRTLRRIGSFICTIQMLIYTTFMLYAPSLALSQVTGLNLWISVTTVGVLATIYTSLGGIKAVMWTDVFQIIVVFVSLVISIVKGVVDVGGLAFVFEKGLEGGRLKLSMEADLRVRYTVWSVSIASFVKWVSFYGMGQMFIQRYVSAPTKRRAQVTVFLNVLGNGLFFLCTFLGGLVIYAKYWDCDPLATKKVRTPDQILPLFMMGTLHVYPGLSGLFVAGLFCGSLSTISSALNSLAAMALEDFVKAFKRWKNISSKKAATVSKILTVFFGAFSLALVPLFANLGSILQTNAYNSHTFGGIIFGLFTLGMFVPWANSLGASIGVAAGFIFSQWMSIGTQMHKPFTPRSPMSTAGCLDGNNTFVGNVSMMALTKAHTQENDYIFPLYQIAFGWIMCLSAIPVILVGMIVSALFKPTKIADLDLRLLSPVVRFCVRKYFLPQRTNENGEMDPPPPQSNVILLSDPGNENISLQHRNVPTET